MKFMEIVETVESIETKLSALSEAKLALLETILEEGAETQFDVEYHIRISAYQRKGWSAFCLDISDLFSQNCESKSMKRTNPSTVAFAKN